MTTTHEWLRGLPSCPRSVRVLLRLPQGHNDKWHLHASNSQTRNQQSGKQQDGHYLRFINYTQALGDRYTNIHGSRRQYHLLDILTNVKVQQQPIHDDTKLHKWELSLWDAEAKRTEKLRELMKTHTKQKQRKETKTESS
eukprot:6294207-Amphidinium_carterae.1